jgi:hypothetical protein
MKGTQMEVSPAIKGQLTKAVKTGKNRQSVTNAVRTIYRKFMPTQQAKHATKKFMAERVTVN